MGKTRKFIPDLRVRKPYKREPKLRVNVHIEAEDDVNETTDYDRDNYSQGREDKRKRLSLPCT